MVGSKSSPQNNFTEVMGKERRLGETEGRGEVGEAKNRDRRKHCWLCRGTRREAGPHDSYPIAQEGLLGVG